MPGHNHRFDEVMIVNPYDPTGAFGQGVTFMPYNYGDSSGMGYYGEPYPYGYAAEPEFADYETVGYYAEPYPYGYAAEPSYAAYEPVGYYGEPYPYGYAADPDFADYETVSYYAEPYPYGYAAEPEFAADEPVGYYADGGEMVGYGAEPFEYPGTDYYGEPDFGGYVKDMAPAFNAGCPVPANVAGYGEAEHLEGYVKPTDVSPSCGNFTPQPGPTASVPDTFRPLWD